MIKNKKYGAVCRARRTSSSASVVTALIKPHECKSQREYRRGGFVRPRKSRVNNLGPQSQRRYGAVKAPVAKFTA